MKNQVQLITYGNRLGKGTLAGLTRLIEGPLKDLFATIHLLPFFTPIDGADAGFDPIDHTEVDRRLGDWDDIQRLSAKTDIMADLIVNHISADSPQFKDYLAKGSSSSYANLFLTYQDVFPQGATEEQLLQIYRPRPALPFTVMDGHKGKRTILWTTFSSQQIDINPQSAAGQVYLESILDRFREKGIRIIRLDAAGYMIKKPNTSCFMIPETYEALDELTEKARQRDMEVLVEIHAHYQTQLTIARQVDRVYDFALPALVLHTLFTGNAQPLKQWLQICPRNAITVLDTHDGIGVMDVAADRTDPNSRGLLEDEEIDRLVERIHHNSRGESRRATGGAASNLDLYQINCTYYDALGRSDRAYLISRLIQFFTPGIPQVYYVGLLAGHNDMDLLARSNVGRDINRHTFSEKEIQACLDKTIVQDLFTLIRFRNCHAAFQGNFILEDAPNDQLVMSWSNDIHWAKAQIDLKAQSFVVRHSTIEGTGQLLLTEDGKLST